MIDVEKIVHVLKAKVEGLIGGTMAYEIKDCKCTGYCALGALLAASGITDRRLKKWDHLLLWTPILEFDYGLTPEQSRRLMNYGDISVLPNGSPGLGHDSRQERLDRLDSVVEFVRNMAVAS